MRVILIDDYLPFLAVLSALLQRQPDIEVVGQALNGEDGLRLAAELKPDLVLVDYSMYGTDGCDVTRTLKSTTTPPQVIMLSFHHELEYRQMALQAGVDAFVGKSEIHEKLLPLLEKIDSKRYSQAWY
jgi:DNA-binding NarL/FixJ family response regulator